MPYAPTVNDRSGEILAAFQASAADTRAQGMQSFGQSIGNGLAAMGSGIAGGMTKAAENAIKYNEAAGMLDAYRSNAESLGLSLDMLNGIEEKYSKDPDKLLGHLTVLGSIANSNLSMQRENARIEGYKDLSDYKSANTPASATTQPKLNSESIRSMVAEAKQAGFTDDAIKAKLGQQYGDWAVRSVYPPQNQGIWMGQ
jgi:hypothetical protein